MELIAAGGVCGAEGGCWIAVTGEKEQEEFAEQIIASVADEPPFSIGFSLGFRFILGHASSCPFRGHLPSFAHVLSPDVSALRS